MSFIKEIKLSNGMIAFVDDEDYETVNKWKWQVNSGGYAKGKVGEKGNMKTLLMHRYILNPSKDKYVDHINHNKLDNRKSNLRICSPQQNTANMRKPPNTQTTYKGVRYKNGNYEASIGLNGDNIYIGSFENEISAANAYNYYAIKHFGEFAFLNDVPFMGKEEFELHRREKKVFAKYKGVSFNKQKEKWLVRVCLEGKMTFVGWFSDEVEGAIAYDKFVIENKLNKKLNFDNMEGLINVQNG